MWQQVRERLLSWHTLVQFLVGASLGRMMLDHLEGIYGDAPWWFGLVIYMAMGFLVSVVYDDLLEIPARLRGEK